MDKHSPSPAGSAEVKDKGKAHGTMSSVSTGTGAPPNASLHSTVYTEIKPEQNLSHKCFESKK